jgi:type VI secretion system protein ImpJ
VKPVQRVVWSEGMFLSPQHLQQLDAYHEELLQTRMVTIGPYHWGVVSADLSREALGAGQVQLERFFGILPDGLLVRFDRGEPEAPLARPVDEHMGPGVRSLEVYLGVPKERADATPGASGNTRYRPAQRPVADMFPANPTSTTSVRNVTFAQRSVQLLFGTEPREDFECIKVAELARDNMGALQPDPSYVPPCLRLDASPYLLDGLRKLLGQMAAKQRILADTRRQRDASSGEFTSADLTRFLQLRALDGALPLLNHLVDAAEAHPHFAYLGLLQIAGELMAFDAQADPLALPKFQFTALGPTFGALFESLNRLLAAVAVDQCINLPLEMRPGGLYVAKLEDDRLARCSQFILTVKSDLSEQQVIDQLPRLSKIASFSEIHRIVQAAAPGVPLQPTFRPPPEVPVRPGVVYFSLTTTDNYWKNAVRDRAVALYLPQPFDPSRTKVELLAVPGTGS